MKKESQENFPTDIVDRIFKWSNEQEEYPLHVRAAAKLYLEGVSEEQLNSALTEAGGSRHPFAASVYNALRDFHTGFNKITPQLQKFTEQME